ncbi:uncharacterized protein LOC129959881 [Argiope bruennichi]|uniref:uncharacterized protein LOC129959881 n=1 Tax=Argiope bruennichi TaxID=94029 RepID=UPI002493E80C|nr:uncharacterized protein LOC129959881 [Argiope bruennichi]
MFKNVKGFKKEDLITLLEESNEPLPAKVTITNLKEVILNSQVYKNDPEFVQEVLFTIISERQENESRKHQEDERKRHDEEIVKQRQYELELTKVSVGVRLEVPNYETVESGRLKTKFHSPKLELRQFSRYLKDWLPFWSQFEHVHNDVDTAPENKFQYLIQATVSGSRAQEVVKSFPLTGANYSKVIESLKSRFGRSDLLIEFYVRELLKLVIENT